MMTRQTVRRFCFTTALLVAMPLVIAGYEQQLRELAGKMADRLAASNRNSVAVVDFTDLQGNATELGRFLAEELSVQLAMVAKGFKVIDRTHLKAILQEHKLASSGVIDSQTARKLGQIAGVETLVTGNITPFGDSVRVSVKVLDTATAEMIGASTSDIPRTKVIDELLTRAIGSATGVVAAGTAQSSASGVMSKTVEMIRFDLHGCTRSGASVKCSLTVTNEGKDSSLTIYVGPRWSKAFDEVGNEYPLTSVTLANNSMNAFAGTEARLISGVPTPATFSFADVAQSAARFSAMDVTVRGDHFWIEAQVQFRNVSITR